MPSDESNEVVMQKDIKDRLRRAELWMICLTAVIGFVGLCSVIAAGLQARNGQEAPPEYALANFQAQEQQPLPPNCSECQKQAQMDVERDIGRYTGWLVLVGAVQLLALIGQVLVYVLTLSQMRDASRRQLRAYVVCESGAIVNVANPVPIYQGQVFPPTGAEITNPAAGPIARIQIQNTGQTPAFEVRNWGNICFREYPLTAGLAGQLPRRRAVPSVLGHGIMSTKLLQLNPLTPPQIADLRAGTGAVYVYGEITYIDAFGRKQYTKYRLMHHTMGGAIGVSTDLSFTEEGNEAS